jgi:acetyl-CoA acetyltransferase
MSWQPGACAIAGIGTTDYSRDSGRSDLTLATQAVLAALDDAGLEPSDVDGIVRCDMDLVRHNDLAESLGIQQLSYWGECGPGGVAPCALVGQAVGAILSGQATTVVVFRALNGRSGRRYGAAPTTAGQQIVGGNVSYDEFFLPYGLLTAGQMFALMAQRHMIEYGSTEEQLGSIAVTCRDRALANPSAQMYGRPLAMDDYLSARMISSPLRLYDYCLETDGAAAVVVTTAGRARDCRHGGVLIHAVAQASLPGTQPGTMFPALLRESITALSSRAVADILWKRAGMGPADVDVAQLYDCFTITLLLQLEDYGFADRGQGGAFAADGGIDLAGPLPCNTSGGHLSEGYIHGMNHVVEAVRQVRRTSTAQVPGAEVSMVTSAPPPASSALILTADR